MKEEVTEPLLQEVKTKDELCERLRGQAARHEVHFKVMNAIIRLPAMVDQFQKARRRQESAQLLKKNEQEAIQILRGQGVNPDTQDQFFDRFLINLEQMATDLSPKKSKAKEVLD